MVERTLPSLGSAPRFLGSRPLGSALSPAAGPHRGAGTPLAPSQSFRTAFPGAVCFHGVLLGGSGVATEYASSVECLQQKLEALRVYQDTAACRYV